MTQRIEATLQHCQMIQRKIESLQGALASAREQMFHDIAVQHRANRFTEDDLADLYHEVRQTGTGFHAQWEKIVGVNTCTLRHVRIARDRTRKNGPGGLSWVGTYPIAVTDPAPANWSSVVYVLYDSANEPIYVGSTWHFRERMNDHWKNGKPIARWMACPAGSREAAYLMEDGLLKERKPSMNRKAGR